MTARRDACGDYEKRRMKILVIWGESLFKPGGGTVHCLGLVDGLRTLGHGVRVISPRYAGQDDTPARSGFRTLRLPRRNLLSFALFQLLAVLLLPAWLVRYRPDTVYVRSCFLQGVMAAVSRAMGIPLVGEVDSIVDEEILMRGRPRWAAFVIRGMDYINNRLVSGLVCVTAGLRDESIRRGGRPDCTVAIPNGARTALMVPGDRPAARHRLGLAPEPFIVGFAGTFAPWQGLDMLVPAASMLKDRPGAAVLFALMGEGRVKGELQQSILAAGLDEMFVFLPGGTTQDVALFLSACDAVVIPIHDPRKLNYGLSPLKFWDAVSAGLPVFVPADCELDEPLEALALPGVFRPGDPGSLAGAVAQAADEANVHRGRREQVHAEVCRRYGWDTVAARVAAFLESLRAGKNTVRQCA